MATTPTKQSKPTDTDYSDLGRATARVMSHDLVELIQRPHRIFLVSLVRGAGIAVGGVIGLGVFAILFGVLVRFGHGLPVLGQFLESIGQNLQR